MSGTCRQRNSRLPTPSGLSTKQVPFAALSSDNPATAWADADNVFVSIKAAVLRRAYNGADMGQAEAITVPQALLLYTGRASGIAPLDGVGLIQPGYEGSFVVLDRDIFGIPAGDIDQVRVERDLDSGRTRLPPLTGPPVGAENGFVQARHTGCVAYSTRPDRRHRAGHRCRAGGLPIAAGVRPICTLRCAGPRDNPLPVCSDRPPDGGRPGGPCRDLCRRGCFRPDPARVRPVPRPAG